jgi:hypothetical protein
MPRCTSGRARKTLPARHLDLHVRNAVFAGALSINRGIDAILATDRAFDGIDGLERINPTDQQAVATLTG